MLNVYTSQTQQGFLVGLRIWPGSHRFGTGNTMKGDKNGWEGGILVCIIMLSMHTPKHPFCERSGHLVVFFISTVLGIYTSSIFRNFLFPVFDHLDVHIIFVMVSFRVFAPLKIWYFIEGMKQCIKFRLNFFKGTQCKSKVRQKFIAPLKVVKNCSQMAFLSLFCEWQASCSVQTLAWYDSMNWQKLHKSSLLCPPSSQCAPYNSTRRSRLWLSSQSWMNNNNNDNAPRV